MALAPLLARRRLYYGWYIVGVAFVAQFMAMINPYTLGVFLKPMVEELGWTRAMFTGVQSFSTLLTGVLALSIGGFLDRRGARGLMILGAITTGGGLIALNGIANLWHFLIIRGVVITVGLLLMGSLVANVAVSNWFITKRGRAVAIGTMGLSLGAAVFTPLSEWLLASMGWRQAWVALGFMVWAALILPAALLMRRRPEDLGLEPDGAPAGALSPDSEPGGVEDAVWTRRETVATGAFWLIVASFSLSSMAMGAVLVNLFSYLTDAGLPSRSAALLMAMAMVAALAFKLPWGLLMERFPIRYCSVAAFLISGASLALLLGAVGTGLMFPALLLWGVAVAGPVPLQEVVWANYYGRLSLGTVRSIGVPFTTMASAAGPVMAGILFDVTGSYTLAFALLAALYPVAAFLILLAKPPPSKPLPKAYP